MHVELVAFFLTCQGYSCLLTVVNRFPQWPSPVTIKDISAKSAVNTILSNWISEFGVPNIITADCGTQFCSFLLRFSSLLGAKHIKRTVYHPSANGLEECFH